jgi:antitoxin FitA
MGWVVGSWPGPVPAVAAGCWSVRLSRSAVPRSDGLGGRVLAGPRPGRRSGMLVSATVEKRGASKRWAGWSGPGRAPSRKHARAVAAGCRKRSLRRVSGQRALDPRTRRNYADSMTRTIHLRNVPEFLYRRREAKAADAGIPLSDFLLAEVRRIAEVPASASGLPTPVRPTPEELWERLQAREPVVLSVSPESAVREERGAVPPGNDSP